MPKKSLFLCNTPIQLMNAINIKYNMLMEKDIDILITDHMSGAKKIVENANKALVGSKVYLLPILDYLSKKHGKIAYLKNSSAIKKGLDQIHDIVWDHSDFYFANIDMLTAAIYQKIHKKDIHCHLFEEGLSTYSESFMREVLDMRLKKGFAMDIVDINVYQKDRVQMRIDDIEYKTIPFFDKKDKAMLQTLNRIFDYREELDRYDPKVIFFEESYYADGKDVGDLKIVKALADHYGKENIMIKLHPRSKIDRFKASGYKTNANTSIPWELILLNQSIEDKLLCTLMSNAVLSPWWMGIKAKCIMFYNCVDRSLLNHRFLDVIEEVCANAPEIFQVVRSLDELFAL